MTASNRIAVRFVPGKGRGVFALAPVQTGDVLETAPAVALDAGDTDALPGTRLDDYYFAHPTDPDGGLLVFGSASLCNHSDEPSVETTARVDGPAGWFVEMRALRDLIPGEELTRRYACDPWFEVSP